MKIAPNIRVKARIELNILCEGFINQTKYREISFPSLVKKGWNYSTTEIVLQTKGLTMVTVCSEVLPWLPSCFYTGVSINGTPMGG
jgi:hypothetical protein